MNRCLLVMGVAAAAFSAAAQPAGRRPGQAIVFSAPDDDGVSSNLPSLTAKPPELLDLANAVQSPGANLRASSEAGPTLDLPAPAVSPIQTRQAQRLLDEQQNWPLMTPEEIFGLPSRKNILGITDRDAFGQPKSESVVAEYQDRQGQSQVRTNGDNHGAADAASHHGLWGGQELQFNPDIWTPAGGKPENSAVLNQFLNPAPDKRAAPASAQRSGWSKLFNLPAPSPKPAPEQQAAMEQFQQMLQPHSPPGDAGKSPALGSPIFAPAAAVPATESAAAVPLGVSYTPLSVGITMPSGAAPLPSLFNTNNATPAFAPAWKPEPPPWASSAPQLGVMPQRKF